MIDHAWLQVSYMAQIIVACLLFMIPVAKRRRFPARFASCTIVLLMIAYMFGAAVTVPDNLLLVILYWPAFAVICLPAVALCLQAGLSEVLYCTICANATQHAANECYLALSIALGRTTPDLPTLLNGLLTTVIYIAIYGAFFIMFARKLAVHGHYRVNRNDLFPMACILLFVWDWACCAMMMSHSMAWSTTSVTHYAAFTSCGLSAAIMTRPNCSANSTAYDTRCCSNRSSIRSARRRLTSSIVSATT